LSKNSLDFPCKLTKFVGIKRIFFKVAGFPGIVGVVDGTHVQIIAPSVDENEFIKRHHYHSINAQGQLQDP
jgi:hypothetical protein